MTKIHRRDFLSGIGAACATLYLAPRRAHALLGDTPNLYITIEAAGGWDASILMDPKTSSSFTNSFSESDIRQVGDIRFAPRYGHGSQLYYQCGPDNDRQSFFHKYGHRMTVINGIDTQTNSHDVGPRHVFSGNHRDGSPNFSALVAAVREDDAGEILPFGFIGTGGYIETQGIISAARAGGTDPIYDLIRYRDRNARLQDNPEPFIDESALDLIRQAEADKFARRRAEPLLPRVQHALAKMRGARLVEDSFGSIASELSRLPELSPLENTNFGIRSAQGVLAALSSGGCASAHIAIPGFDTHSGVHDSEHPERAEQLFGVIDYVWRMAELLGIDQRLTVIVGSDFSRTTYNSGSGKDHWPITSMMLMGNGIAGGRVIGSTSPDEYDDEGNALAGVSTKPVRVEGDRVVVSDVSDPDAEVIKPGHIHQALRAHAGVSGHTLHNRFRLNDQRMKILPIFT